jgi:outer membrane biosynthesis protein TonB
MTTLEHNREAKNRRIAALFTTLFWGLVLLFCLFTIVWSPPDPPIPVYGLEVNFGTDDAGFGKVQNRNPANDNKQLEDARPKDEVSEKTTPETKPVIDPIRPTPVDEQPVEETPQTQDDNSPDVREEKPAEKKPTQEQKPKTDGNTSNQGTSNNNSANNNGNVPGTLGDQGKPTGDLNSDALLGSGGAGGASLSMDGWRWDAKPTVNDASSEVGKLIFEVKIDNEGEIISVKLVYRSVSREVANAYEQAVYDLTFSPLPNNTNPAAQTTGRITFVITAK